MPTKRLQNVVAIVGRPNVGKSTFFNRCIGTRRAIIDDSPGVTRDCLYHECSWAGHEFLLVDTGGFLPKSKDQITQLVKEQLVTMINEADIIVFLVNGKEGVTGADLELANILRKTKKRIFLCVNKIDKLSDNVNLSEFYQLGLGEPLPMSALRGTGNVGDFLDKIIEVFPKETSAPEPTAEGNFSLAIVGKPNVGKSSIVNFLCGKARAIVSDVPGTTRDSIDVVLPVSDRQITLIDTAGIRKKSKVAYGIEAFSVVRAIKAIERASVVAMILDATQPISEQDQKIAQKIIDAGKAVIVVFNKWDLIPDKSSKLMNEFTEKLAIELPHLKFAPIVFTSTTNGQRIPKILESAIAAFEETNRRVSTATLNQVLREAQMLTPPPSGKRGRRLRIYYGTQVSIQPPSIALFINDEKLAENNYLIYLERKIREAYGFIGTPIRFFLRPKKES